MTAPAIRVRHLWHRFGRLEVLRDVSFEVGRGEIFGFIGPNGAGKTTTIRIMATLLDPMAGRVEVCGKDVTVEPESVRRSIGYMPDHAGVYERVSVREYLEFFADAYSVTEGGTNYRVVDAVMDLVDLTKLSDKLVSTMSKGMKQRLQLARTLLHDPEVLILDEPASDLDPRARIEMRDLLGELRDLGKTIFLSSHILTELSDVCTSVAIMERGRLVVAGPIREIADRLRAVQAADHPQGTVPQGSTDGSPDGTGTSGGTPGPGTAALAMARIVRLRVLGPRESAVPWLRQLPAVRNVAPGPADTLLVEFVGDDGAIGLMVQTLVSAGLLVVGVEPERNELERIFMEVTRGDLQ